MRVQYKCPRFKFPLLNYEHLINSFLNGRYFRLRQNFGIYRCLYSEHCTMCVMLQSICTVYEFIDNEFMTLYSTTVLTVLCSVPLFYTVGTPVFL